MPRHRARKCCSSRFATPSSRNADGEQLTLLSRVPPSPRANYVFAHGAGAGMTHPSMEGVAQALYDAGIATARYQFPYRERGSKRPDPPPICHAAVRAAVLEAARIAPGLPLIA